MRLVLCCVLIGLTGSGGKAQEGVQVVSTRASCARCRVILEPVAQLGRAEDTVALTANSRVVRDGRGRYYVAPTDRPGVIAVYQPDGTLLQALGRAGGAPGEFRGPDVIAVGPGDSLWVFDGPRLTLLDPAYRVIRTRLLPVRVHAAVALESGELVLQGLQAAAGPAAAVFQLLGSGDSIVRSFGAVVSLGEPGPMFWRLARAGRDRVWGAPFNAYRLERWSSAGERELVLEREVARFRRWELTAPDLRRPVLMAVSQADTGLVWVAVRVAKPGWRAPAAGVESEIRPPPSGQLLAHLASRLEAIDPVRGELRVSGEVGQLISGFLGHGLAYGFQEDAQGLLTLQVWRLAVRQR